MTEGLGRDRGKKDERRRDEKGNLRGKDTADERMMG